MHTPRINIILAAIYILSTIAVFIAAIISPVFRQFAPAPLRDVLLPPPKPIVVSVLYSTEKEAWLEETIRDFNNSRPIVDGHPIQIELEKMGSREIYLSVLDHSRQPVLISPASSLQIAILHELSQVEFGYPIVDPAGTDMCRSVFTTPLVLAAWKERADVLWGNQPPLQLWQKLHDDLLDPRGWEAYNHPEWGYIKFGHTDPTRSNSGFMTILLMAYNYHNKASGLTSQDILGDQEFQKWFIETEKTISQFEQSTGPLMSRTVTYGPSVYDLVAVYEATALEHAENAVGRYGELRIYYPPQTVWSDHPFCLTKGDWVTPEQKKAASLFLDYMLSYESQEKALLTYGFRPVDKSIPIDSNASPFTRYISNGFQANLSSINTVEIPNGQVLNTLLELWIRSIQR